MAPRLCPCPWLRGAGSSLASTLAALINVPLRLRGGLQIWGESAMCGVQCVILTKQSVRGHRRSDDVSNDVLVWLAGRNSIEFPMVGGRQILKCQPMRLRRTYSSASKNVATTILTQSKSTLSDRSTQGDC